jgi:UDP-N-acetylglucosamine--N-acetylmuramyl-(pentapeptide) pyrophosphoryl-undecaprenol N-acetylglucosamine transferase
LKDRKVRVLIASGGTGGHVFPAIAVAEEVKRHRPDAKFLFIGARKQSLENFCFGYDAGVVDLPAVGMPRRVSVELATFAVKMVASFDLSLRRVASFRPHIAIGFGNFGSVGPLLAARIRGVPTVIHEANAIPGKANLLLSRFSDKVLVHFPRTARHFPNGNVEVVGMPVRTEFGQKQDRLGALARTKLSGTKLTLLVIGGSQGARALNIEVCDAIPILQKMSSRIQVIHLTGESDYEWVRRCYENTSIRAYVAPFESRMKLLYDAADLVVARAGASTIAEIIQTGKPALLVPFPYATSQHQDENARHLERTGGAVVLRQQLASSERPSIPGFQKTLLDLIEDRRRRWAMAESNRKLCNGCAAHKIAEVLLRIARPEVSVCRGPRRRAAAAA